MSTLPLQRPVFASGSAGAGDERGSWLSRPGVVLSIVAHLAVLVVASQWHETTSGPVVTRFEWVGSIEPPVEPLSPPVMEPAAVPTEPATPAPAPRAAAPPEPAPPPVVAPEPEARVPPPVAPAAGPSRLDLDAARRAAAAAVVQQRARDGVLLRSPIGNPVPEQPTAAQTPPSIFEPQRHSGGGVLQPGKARTAFGQRLSLWCNRVSGGGFGFFGIPVCASRGIEPPSGIFADSIPEYMKLKPECEETQPLAAALGEAGAFPTVKCRLVPKDPDD